MVSGLNRPICVTSLTRFQTAAGEALIRIVADPPMGRGCRAHGQPVSFEVTSEGWGLMCCQHNAFELPFAAILKKTENLSPAIVSFVGNRDGSVLVSVGYVVLNQSPSGFMNDHRPPSGSRALYSR